MSSAFSIPKSSYYEKTVLLKHGEKKNAKKPQKAL
jgi:hypothetical protein